MERIPTYAGTVEDKDSKDISYWAFQKTAFERLEESWRLHCCNYNIPFDISIDKTQSTAQKRNG